MSNKIPAAIRHQLCGHILKIIDQVDPLSYRAPAMLTAIDDLSSFIAENTNEQETKEKDSH